MNLWTDIIVVFILGTTTCAIGFTHRWNAKQMFILFFFLIGLTEAISWILP